MISDLHHILRIKVSIKLDTLMFNWDKNIGRKEVDELFFIL